jgi:transposase InsO family protein
MRLGLTRSLRKRLFCTGDLQPAILGHQICHQNFSLFGMSPILLLTVIDTYSRYSPVIDPRFSYRGEDVVATLERVCPSIGYPIS